MKTINLKALSISVMILAMIGSCEVLPNLDPDNPSTEMCIFEVGATFDGSYSFAIDVPMDGEELNFSFLRLPDGESDFVHELQISKSAFGFPGGSFTVPILINRLEFEITGLLEPILLAESQLVGGNMYFVEWLPTSVNYAYESCNVATNTCVGETLCFGSPCAVDHKFIPFAFGINSDVYYGWIEISQQLVTTSPGSTKPETTIHEIAFSKLANRAVRMGER